MRSLRRTVPALAWLIAILGSSLCALADPASPADLLSTGHVDDAIRLLKDRVQATPKDGQAFNLLARTYFYMGRWDDAVVAAERAVTLDPSNSDYHLWLARCVGEKAAHSSFLTAVRMVGRIRSEFERAVQLNGSNAAARTDLAEFYMEAPPFLGGSKDKALAQAQALTALDESSSHWVKARLAERAKLFDAAEQEYRAAVTSSKHPAGRWLDLAAFYRTRAQLDLMENAVNKAIAEGSADTSIQYDAALTLFLAGRNFAEARQLVQKYLASPSQPEAAPAYRAHYLLGSILEKQGDIQAAAAEYRTSLSLAHQFDLAQTALNRISR